MSGRFFLEIRPSNGEPSPVIRDGAHLGNHYSTDVLDCQGLTRLQKRDRNKRSREGVGRG